MKNGFALCELDRETGELIEVVAVYPSRLEAEQMKRENEEEADENSSSTFVTKLTLIAEPGDVIVGA